MAWRQILTFNPRTMKTKVTYITSSKKLQFILITMQSFASFEHSLAALIQILYEPRDEKTGLLPTRKQRRRLAVQ